MSSFSPHDLREYTFQSKQMGIAFLQIAPGNLDKDRDGIRVSSLFIWFLFHFINFLIENPFSDFFSLLWKKCAIKRVIIAKHNHFDDHVLVGFLYSFMLFTPNMWVCMWCWRWWLFLCCFHLSILRVRHFFLKRSEEKCNYKVLKCIVRRIYWSQWMNEWTS